MAKYVVFHGDVIIHPGVYTWVDYSQVENILAGVRGVVALIGEAEEGEPGIVTVFSRARDGIDYFKSGPLADAIYAVFNPSTDPAVSKPFRIVAVKTNSSTVASALFTQGANSAITLTARRYGVYGNTIRAEITNGSEPGTKLVRISTYDKSEQSGDLSGAVFTVQRIGVTSATLTVDDNGVTAIAEGDVEHVYPFSTYPTAQAIANDLSSDINYIVSLSTGVDVASNTLDRATYNIAGITATVRALTKSIVDWVNMKSILCTATVNAYLVPDNAVKQLSGGSKGISTATDVQNALNSIAGLNIDFVVPLFDRDIEGLTMSAVVNALKSHISEANQIKSTTERQAFLGIYGPIETLKQYAIVLNSPYFTLFGQRVKGTKADMSSAELGVWYLACMVAGIKAGTPVGEPLTFKRVNILDLVDVFANQTIEDLLLSGVGCVEQVPGIGFRLVKDITTYLSTDNDILCSASAMESILYIKKGLRTNLERFVGAKGLPRTIQAIKGAVIGYLTILSTGYDAILMSTTDAQGNLLPPFRNLEVTLVGNVINVRVELTIVPGIDYILNEVIPTKARL